MSILGLIGAAHRSRVFFVNRQLSISAEALTILLIPVPKVIDGVTHRQGPELAAGQIVQGVDGDGFAQHFLPSLPL